MPLLTETEFHPPSHQNREQVVPSPRTGCLDLDGMPSESSLSCHLGVQGWSFSVSAGGC